MFGGMVRLKVECFLVSAKILGIESFYRSGILARDPYMGKIGETHLRSLLYIHIVLTSFLSMLRLALDIVLALLGKQHVNDPARKKVTVPPAARRHQVAVHNYILVRVDGAHVLGVT